MTKGQLGALIGGGLAIVWAALGFWSFIGVVIASLIGYTVARVVTGDLDLARVLDALRGRKSSS